MAEAVFGIRRRQRGAYRHQIHQGGRGIEQGIEQRRQQADGIRHEIGEELGADEYQRDAHRGIGGLAHQSSGAILPARRRRPTAGPHSSVKPGSRITAARSASPLRPHDRPGGRAGGRAGPPRIRCGRGRTRKPDQWGGRGTAPMPELGGELRRPASPARSGRPEAATAPRPRRRSGWRAAGGEIGIRLGSAVTGSDLALDPDTPAQGSSSGSRGRPAGLPGAAGPCGSHGWCRRRNRGDPPPSAGPCARAGMPSAPTVASAMALGRWAPSPGHPCTRGKSVQLRMARQADVGLLDRGRASGTD